MDYKLHNSIIHDMNVGIFQYSDGNNRIHKPENDHWDTFDRDYYDFISDPVSWNKFRRNGITCMLETGLYGKHRKDYIKNRKHYNEYYSDVEVIEMQNRIDELRRMAGDDFISRYLDCVVGSPCHCVIDGEKYNFDDVYNIYALWQISRTFKYLNNQPNQILEIGAGYGPLCGKLLKMYPGCKYIILDLPETLAVQHYNLSQLNPDWKILTISDLQDNDLETLLASNYDIVLLPSWYGSDITKTKFDLVVNMRSLGEMTMPLLNYYFGIIHNQLSERGIFYCVNRYVFTSSAYKLKLKDYPFDEDWNFLISQPQWLQTHLHEWVALRESNPKVSPSFMLQSMSERVPPPGPIMEDILPQKTWIENNMKGDIT